MSKTKKGCIDMQKRKIVSRLSATMLAGVMGTSSLLPGLSAAAAAALRGWRNARCRAGGGGTRR